MTAHCNGEDHVTGGGFTNQSDLHIIVSEPTTDASGWHVHVKNDRLLPGVWSFGAWAVCAHVIRVESIPS